MTKLIEITGKSLSGEWGSDDETGNGIPVLRTTNFTNTGIVNFDNVVTRTITKKNIDEKYLRKGDIIIEKSGGSDKQPVGRVIYFEGEEKTYLFNNFTGLLRVKDSNKWISKYVFYALYHNYLVGGTRAFENKTTGLHNLKTDSYVSSFNIEECSIQKQNIVVSTLDKLQSIITHRQKQLEKLDELIKARFVEMFGDVVINDKCYPVKALPEIAEYWNGLTYKPEDVSEKGTIVLRSSNIQNSCLDFADTVRVSCKIGDKKYVKNNDILMCSRNGSARLVGKVALIDNISEPMSFGAFMMIIRSKYYHYLMTYFQMSAFRMQIATGATTTINQITGNMLNKVQLPVPDMQTIEKFADFVKQVNKSKFAVQKELDKTKMLFDSLMQEYFG